VALIDGYGWQRTLVIFAAIVLLIMPLSLALATPRDAGAGTAATAPPQTFVQKIETYQRYSSRRDDFCSTPGQGVCRPPLYERNIFDK
jgi:hypothetical protein